MREPSSLDWAASYKEEPKDLVSACIVCLESKIHPFTDVISFMKVSIDLEDSHSRICATIAVQLTRNYPFLPASPLPFLFELIRLSLRQE